MNAEELKVADFHCTKIAEAEAAMSVNEKKWLVMHMHVQLKLDEVQGPPNPWLTVADFHCLIWCTLAYPSS
jgi:hypothetical protein